MTAPLRSPDAVMHLDRLGASHPTRLSFARALLRQGARDGWRLSVPVWALDPDGYGRAVLTLHMPHRAYSLVAFSQALAPERRTDRVIADAWDATFVLYDGIPDAEEVERLAGPVPRQEAGRFTARELVLSRANKSVRLFDTVVATLAEGRQPTAATLDAVGYLMRTTAVYGNGKFGIADRDDIHDRPELAGPFRAEMLTVWLIRAFTVRLADHCAAARSPHAVPLAPALRRRLGVGNSTGLGMAPFLLRHPALLDAWIGARETALARVRTSRPADPEAWAAFKALVRQARDGLGGWHTDDAVQGTRIEELGRDLAALAATLEDRAAGPTCWDDLYGWAEAHCGLEAQELCAALMIEPNGPLVDDLADRMGADEAASLAIDGRETTGALRATIDQHYGWALAHDFAHPATQARFWYVSAEKLEPRLGDRWSEPGAEREMPIGFARDVAALHDLLGNEPADTSVAAFLARHPAQRHAVRRVQIAARHPYAEVRGNLLGDALRPVDLLRCKLAFFGATCFDPRSDRWLRISLFRDAPDPEELGTGETAARAAA